MEGLPDSVLLQVFQYLPLEELCLAARMVCSRWRAVSHDADLWKFIEIPDHFSDNRMLKLLEPVSIAESIDSR